jgi:isopenicillin N synthase-like dioxygenase
VLRAIDNALATNGVFVLENHDAPADLASKVDDISKNFFGLPREQKAKLARGGTTTRGWTDDELTKQRLDLKELYGYGSQRGVFDTSEKGVNGDGANRFYSVTEEHELNVGGMHDCLEEHFMTSQRIGRRLLEAMAVVLGRSDEEVDALVKEHNSFAVLNYFAAGRAAKEGEGLLGVHPHTDAGLLTLLRLDSVSGLEVLVRADRNDGSSARGDDHFGDVRAGDAWVAVPPPKQPNTLVVNLGDMAQVWSNDRWHAAVHRVQAPRGTQARYSHAHFMNPSQDAEFGGTVSPRYSAFSWANFRAARAKGDANDVGGEVQIADYRVDR